MLPDGAVTSKPAAPTPGAGSGRPSPLQVWPGLELLKFLWPKLNLSNGPGDAGGRFGSATSELSDSACDLPFLFLKRQQK